MKNNLFPKLVKECTGLEAVAEYRFHPKRLWRFDYVILSHKIALEVEGGVWVNGRHTRGSGFVKDMEKYNEAARLGYRLIRVQPEELLTGYTIDLIKDMTEIPEPAKELTARVNLN